MNQARLRRFAVWSLIAIFACLGRYAVAQATNTGTIVGTVADQSGAVVPDANVTLTDPLTNSTRLTKTNATGGYVFTDVAPGKYELSIGKSGFAVSKVQTQVEVGMQTTINVKLRVGNERTTIEVIAEGPQLQTLNATIGGAIDPAAIETLPSLLHDAGTFTELQPGVSPDGSVAGTVVDQSTFILDGGNNSNDMDGSMSVYTGSFAGDPTGGAGTQSSAGDLAPGPTGVMPTPQDSVEEFKVNTANQTAEFNNSAGAQVEVVTKRGTDKFHGTVYDYYLDNNLNANTWANNLSGTPNPSYHYNKFGASIGGPMLPRLWGGKTYFFGMYQGWRFPQAETFERSVPSASLLAGIITDPKTGNTFNMKAIDPRGIGINPDVLAMWQKYEPQGNDPSCGSLLGNYCDQVNTIGYKANMAIPEDDNFWVARFDHSFGDKWQWMASYRYYKLTKASDTQVDTGGFFPGDKLGVPTSVANRPQQPWFLVTGLTTSISPRLTNDFHFSFLRNFWQWSDQNAPPQLPGLGGALEPFGEGAAVHGVLAPFNVNTQSIRTRFWDGHDTFLRDDMTYLKGKHMLQFGGQFQRNWNYHQRSDNGGGINFTPTYQLGDGSGAGLINLSGLGGGFPSGSTSVARVAAAAYGMVTDSQVAYTRSGPTLALNPPLTHAFDQSTILYYNTYISDTWHLKPSFTLTYGLGWTLELPPTEATGKQDVLVDDTNEPVSVQSYLHQRQLAAQQGNVYNPELGFALVHNVGNSPKYPYNPYYGSFSPRAAAAWNLHFNGDSAMGKIFGADSTVIRGGYGRTFGRLNGVDQVLVPLLGLGLIQAVQCRQVMASGVCGPTNPTETTAFRIGVDGNSAPLPAAAPTLPQPVFPGYNAIAGAASEAIDPQFRPNVIDSFDLTVQRQVSRNTLIEVGYIGRLIHHEFQPINLNAVPYMMTVGGQSFSAAYANLEKALGCATSVGACAAAVPPATVNKAPNPAYSAFINNLAAANPQAFLESSLSKSYCGGSFTNGDSTAYANCTAAVLDNELSSGNLQTQGVWGLWSDLDNGGFTFPRTMQNTAIPGQQFGGNGQATSGIALNASIGYGNYNAGFLSVKTTNWHGLMMQENFTYSKALGTGAQVQATSEYTVNDPFDLRKMYGLQPFQRKFVFNTFMVWDEPWYKNQSGIGHLLGGWKLAPIFTAGSGDPLYCNTYSNAQAFGAADGNNYFEDEQCVFTSKYTGGASAHYGVAGGTDPYGNSVGTAVASSASGTPVPINMFKNPVAVWNSVRAPILGIDEVGSGVGPIYSMPYWNLDLSITKDFKVTERINFEYSMIFTNVLNHTVLADPLLALYSSSSFGVLNNNINNPRNMEFGLRLRY